MGFGQRRWVCLAPALALALGPRLVDAEPERAPEEEPPVDAEADDVEAIEEPEEAPLDVFIHQQPAPEPAGATSLTRGEARLLPGAFGDPFRVVEVLPGTSPTVSGIPFFYVRGSPPGNVGYLIDGIRVPLLFHMGLGPAVVHPALIERVTLHPGGYSATLGRFAGGVVEGELTAPRDEVRGEGNLRLVDAGALLEVPFDEARGNVLAAGRYSFTGLILSAVSAEVNLSYWDYASRASYELAAGERLSLLAFGAYDFLAEQDGDRETLLFDTTFHRFDLRYERGLWSDTALRTDFILGFDQTRLPADRDVMDLMFSARAAVTHQAAPELELRAGGDVTADRYVIDLFRDENVEFETFFGSRVDLAWGGYLEGRLALSKRFELTPGLRVDVYASEGRTAVGVDPRVSSRLKLDDGLWLVQAHGLASQMPSFIVAGPGFRPGLSQGGLQRTFQSSAGVTWELSRDWSTSAIAYRNTFFDVNDALGGSPLAAEGFPEGFGRFDERFDGTSTGIELSLRRRLTNSIGALVSYTLGRSERIAQRGDPFPSGFDRTHVLNAALTFNHRAGYRAAVRMLYYSGLPVVIPQPDGSVFVQDDRLRGFYRFDWRAEKRWRVGETGYVALVLEMQNSFFAQEIIGVRCTATECLPEPFGPITIPSIGVEGGF